MKRLFVVLAVLAACSSPMAEEVWGESAWAVEPDPSLWREGAQELILQGQAFKRDFVNEAGEEIDDWDYNITLAGTYYVTDRTQFGGVISYLRFQDDGGAGIGPFYEYNLYQSDHGLSLFIGGDAQYLLEGADDLAAWQAATRIGIKKQIGNVSLRIAVEYCRGIDGEEETIVIPSNFASALSESPSPLTIDIDNGDKLDRVGLLFGFGWGRTPG